MMQQTKTYQLSKIDVDDNFSPAPLNENVDKVEAKFAALDGADAALASRVTALEGHTVAIGSYTGTNNTLTIKLGYRPKVVWVSPTSTGGDCYIVTALGGYGTLNDNGFTLIGGTYANIANAKYMYIAIR